MADIAGAGGVHDRRVERVTTPAHNSVKKPTQAVFYTIPMQQTTLGQPYRDLW